MLASFARDGPNAAHLAEEYAVCAPQSDAQLWREVKELQSEALARRMPDWLAALAPNACKAALIAAKFYLKRKLRWARSGSVSPERCALAALIPSCIHAIAVPGPSWLRLSFLNNATSAVLFGIAMSRYSSSKFPALGAV